MHKLNTMHRLELLDQELARTWDKTLPCRLRRSSAAWLWHGTHFCAAVATHNSHMADRHKWHTMCLPLRCSAKGRHIWHIVSLHCNVDKTISAGVLHGWLVFRGVARRNLHCTVDMHMWHTMCLPLRCSAKGRHSWHIVSLHCNVDKTISAGVLHGWLVFRGVARRNLHCTVDMHMWHTMCLPLRCSAKGRHSWHIVSLHCNVDKTISAGVLHGWLVFRGVARRNLHCTVDMHMWHTMCLPLRSSARGRHSFHIWALRYSFYRASLAASLTFEGVATHNLHCKVEMRR